VGGTEVQDHEIQALANGMSSCDMQEL